eukprot:g5809.t1
MPKANCAAWVKSCPCSCAGVEETPDPSQTLQWVGKSPPPGKALKAWLKWLVSSAHDAEASRDASDSSIARVSWQRAGSEGTAAAPGALRRRRATTVSLPAAADSDMWRVQLGEQQLDSGPTQVVITDPGAVAGALGVRPGDVITRINAVDVGGWGLEQVWFEMGKARENAQGDKVELELVRGEGDGVAGGDDEDEGGGLPDAALPQVLLTGPNAVRLAAVSVFALLVSLAFCAWRYKCALDALLADHATALKELRRVIDENETLRQWLDEMRNEEADALLAAELAEQHERAAIKAVRAELNRPEEGFSPSETICTFEEEEDEGGDAVSGDNQSNDADAGDAARQRRSV